MRDEGGRGWRGFVWFGLVRLVYFFRGIKNSPDETMSSPEEDNGQNIE